MNRIWHRAATIAGIVALSLPVTFYLTMVLMPVWSEIERRWGVESVGHSGPAGWCFLAVFACVVTISVTVYLVRTRGAASTSLEDGSPP
jgi:hypothetical protein